MSVSRKQLLVLASIALAVVLVDLVSKEFAVLLLANASAAALPASFAGFRFSFALNEGAAGGLWLGDSTRLINIASMSLVVALAAMVSRQLVAAHRLSSLALGLIIGAAAGNMLSLVLSPSVVDFISHDFIGSTIVFNIADIASVAGIAMLVPIAFSLASTIRSTSRQRVLVPRRATMQERIVDGMRKPAVFEREVPLAFASEMVRPLATDGERPAERTIIPEQRVAPRAADQHAP